jgi:hypothetical protein
VYHPRDSSDLILGLIITSAVLIVIMMSLAILARRYEMKLSWLESDHDRNEVKEI